ncbi:AcrR family transcriptional regulator [Microbacteriaceae bacterium SG_E_30_P1]|uniref:AcrR family transcriptional regulator n=1 Tax=Antiquaquibacter oligotrophicus TaxID=2880260 RepID=A0ABT6KNR2_9MICO|nr:TetR/AcrR family transcriptional regulator [Antiquaquibacter oligotrophicus]MDH6181421.1 AcrR family transcriptional regulator [Antiquaquibacter oligotrophicus]UDF12887.1 TetR/AcrR family transcriptional regulator [Antiquaquibacter oligotrophicus]
MRPSIPTSDLLDAAASVIVDRGFSGVRMDAVAARAGVAKGVPYGRFASKQELLLAVIDRELVEAIRHAARLVADDPEGGRFSRLWLHSSAALASRPVLVRLYVDPDSPLPAAAEARRDRLDARALLGAEFIRDLQRADLVDPHLNAAALATNLTLWNYGLAAREPGENNHDLIAGMAGLLARGADTGRGDLEEGKALFAAFAERLIEDRSLS